jgi:hypothetical protein
VGIVPELTQNHISLILNPIKSELPILLTFKSINL